MHDQYYYCHPGQSSSGLLYSSGELDHTVIDEYYHTCTHAHRIVFYRCLVAAGIKDINRPAENISIPQNIGGR